MSELSELEDRYEALKRKNEEYLPKVDPELVQDLLRRERESPGITPMYLVEVFTKPGLDTQDVRQYIIDKTGMCPAIYDNGTHYATNQKLTIEMLEEISDSDDVLEVTGEFTGGLGSYGASHEHRRQEERPTTVSSIRTEYGAARRDKKANKADKGRSHLRVAAYVAAGIIGAIAVAGFVISGGLPPNSNGSASQFSITGSEPGVLFGYVAGPVGGLPAIGTTVIATDLVTGQTTSAFVSIHGQYTLNLAPFTYRIVVAFPDGTSRVLATELEIERGAAQELNISY